MRRETKHTQTHTPFLARRCKVSQIIRDDLESRPKEKANEINRQRVSECVYERERERENLRWVHPARGWRVE